MKLTILEWIEHGNHPIRQLRVMRNLMADALVHAVARDWRTAPLAPPDRALCEFAAKLTLHQHDLSPADLDRLRDHGFDDRAIHDAVQVIGYFNYSTRVADGLGVEPEDFIQRWGR